MSNARLDKIKALIVEEEISTQEELTEKLISSGFEVSQATVSRDIKKLKLVKTQGVKRKIKYVLRENGSGNIPSKIINLFKQITQSICSANNLIIVKTLAGNGNSAGMVIDQMIFPEILGTVSGDDTVLIITKTEKDANYVVDCLRSL